MRRDRVEVDVGQCPGRAPATPQGDQSSYLVIGEGRIDVRGPILVAAGEIAVPVHDVLAHRDPEPQRFQRFHPDPQHLAVVRHLGRGHERNQVALTQPHRPDGRGTERAGLRAGARRRRQCDTGRGRPGHELPARDAGHPQRCVSSRSLSGGIRFLRPMKYSIRSM